MKGTKGMTYSRPYEDPGRVRSSTGKHEFVDTPWAVVARGEATAAVLRFKTRKEAVAYAAKAKKGRS
jgi:hypothetical protein